MAGLRIMGDKAASRRHRGRRTLRVMASGLMSMTALTALVIGAAPARAADVYVGSSFNGTLRTGEYILSTNGHYKLIMQTDGNLVLYRGGYPRSGWTACWGSGTFGETSAEYMLWTPQDAVLRIGNLYMLGDLAGHPFSDTNVSVNNSGVLYVAYSQQAWC